MGQHWAPQLKTEIYNLLQNTTKGTLFYIYRSKLFTRLSVQCNQTKQCIGPIQDKHTFIYTLFHD